MKEEEKAALKKEVRNLKAKLRRREAKFDQVTIQAEEVLIVCGQLADMMKQTMALNAEILERSQPYIEFGFCEQEHMPIEAVSDEPLDESLAKKIIAEWEDLLREGGQEESKAQE